LAEEAAMPPVDVAVHFNEFVAIAKHDRELLANGLVALVSAHLPINEEYVEVEAWRHNNNGLPWIRAVRIFRAQFLTQHHWAVPDSGWVQLDFIPELQKAIDEKNARYARYIANCNECWLLIVASGARPSGLFELSPDTRSHLYNSRFAKTLFLEAFAGQVFELATTSN
jgi:hypothetical protein